MNASRSAKPVAVIGLGNMGSALAEALLAKKRGIVAWNRTAAKSAPLRKLGAEIAASAAEAVSRCDVLVTCVLDHGATMAVLTSDSVAGALKGKTVIQLSTMSAAQSQSLDVWIRNHGARYLDGAILGYPEDVRGASCRMLFSGPRAVFDANRDILDALSNRPIFVGEKPGMALVVDKLVYAQFYGITYAYLHTAAMAAAAGLSVATFRDLVGGDERWQWKGRTMDGFLDRVEARHYGDADATMDAHAAAFDHVLRISRDLGVEPAYPQLIADTISRAMATGHAKHEIAAIFEVFAAGRNS